MQDSFEKSKSKVKLNVGGTVFTTSKSNLTSVKDSFFFYMLSNEKWKPDEDGEYFIDRDPKYFELILHQHRYGECDYSHLSDFEKNMFKVDIDFYGLGSLFPELVKKERQMIKIDDRHDSKGILYWIGTREGTSVWENPFKAGLVDIKSSSPDDFRALNNDEGYSEFVKNEVRGCSYGSDNNPNQWIFVDLKNYLVYPTSYRLCNTRQGNCHPRNWTLDASNDGQNWKVLNRHSDDRTLTDNCQIGNWVINDDSKEKYQYFRINQFDYSLGQWHHLSCCCFEIYGSVINKI